MPGTNVPPGFTVRHFESIGSTNDAAKSAARARAVDGSVFWTGHQSAGRGTHGREWTMPPGNLAVSIVKRPRVPIAFAAQGALVTAVAVADALVALGLSEKRVRLKWPNDVLVDGAKISGILLEGEAQATATRWLVIGTGINLAHHPADTRHAATNLQAERLTVSPDVALSAYLTAFDHWWRRWRRYGFSIVRSAWLSRTIHVPSDMLRISIGREVEVAEYVGLAADGALIVVGDGGSEKRIVSGEIFT